MPVTTVKRCTHTDEYYFTVEDGVPEFLQEGGSALVIKYYDELHEEGLVQLSVGREDALLIRDAINQLYPPHITS